MEISRFATEILRHGNFPVYPVEPVERHGKEVSLVPCRKEKMVLETVKILQNWQKEGHETIGVICRDQEEASWLSSCLKEHLSLAESDLERAEFGEGIMVLPVEYTKGLEFDAVLLYGPVEGEISLGRRLCQTALCGGYQSPFTSWQWFMGKI